MDIFNVLSLFGGLGLFLYGMDVMGDGLKKMAGGKMESILSKLTANKAKGFLLGFIITAIIQSSSATTVMLVGFVNSGIMKLGQTLSVILGANLGTTVTAWILSLGGISGDTFWLKIFKPTSFTPVLMIIGVIMLMACKSDKKRNVSLILIGFATLMFGMNTMSDSMSALKESEQFSRLLIMFSNPIMGILVGTLLTAIIQSSSASIGVLQALSLTGAIPFSTALPIILGQNIGTTITPILSSITGNIESKRVAGACLYIKIIGVVVFSIIFYGLNAIFAFDFMSSSVNMLSIATIHTLFNIADAIVLMPFCSLIEKLVVKTIKGKPSEKSTHYNMLDERFLAMPSFAVEKCGDLVKEMAEISVHAFKSSINMITAYDKETARQIRKDEKKVDNYEDVLGTYLVKLSSQQLSDNESAEVSKILKVIGDFERISDHAVNVLESGEELMEKGIELTPSAKSEMEVLCNAVCEIVDMAYDAFVNNDIEMAKNIEPLEQVIDILRDKMRDNHIRRLQKGTCSIGAGFVLSDLLTNLERTADHCSNLAMCIIDANEHKMNIHESLKEMRKYSADFKEKHEAYLKKYTI